MSFSKRIILYIFIILLVASIYKDLSLRNAGINHLHYKELQTTEDSQYSILKVRVDIGDTVISIVEDLHDGNLNVSAETIMNDFQHLNPNTHPNSMQPESYYYFPLYN
jgi:hypothetical protein